MTGLAQLAPKWSELTPFFADYLKAFDIEMEG